MTTSALEIPVAPTQSILDTFRRMPFMEDAYLYVQARNICSMNRYLKVIENDLRSKYPDPKSIPTDDGDFLAATTEIWLLSVYDLLSNWRDRARLVLMQDKSVEAEPVGPVSRAEVLSGNVLFQKALKKVQCDTQYARKLRRHAVAVEKVFKEVKCIRDVLAKQEVLRSKGAHVGRIAHNRIDPYSGSISYFLRAKHGNVRGVCRAEIADQLAQLIS